MTGADKLLDIARGELGVTERPAGSNRVKYNDWFYGREVSGASYPWCCVFVCWVFDRAGYGRLLRRTGGCTTLMNWFQSRGRLVPVKEAKPGDVAFYQFDSDAYADHVGIVEKVNQNGVTAIEGNTSVTSDDNGGAVMRRDRRWNVIMAVARPDYESVKEEWEMTKEEIEALVGERVRTAVAEAVLALEPRVYTRAEELPAWARPVVERLMAGGIVTGDGTGKLHLTDRDLVAAAMVDKLWLAAGKGVSGHDQRTVGL